MQKKTDILDPTITLPSGRIGTDKEFRSVVRALFQSDAGRVALEYLEYKSLSNLTTDPNMSEEKASLAIGRREFMDLIKRLAR